MIGLLITDQNPETNSIDKDNRGAYTITEAGSYEVTFTIDEADPDSKRLSRNSNLYYS